MPENSLQWDSWIGLEDPCGIIANNGPAQIQMPKQGLWSDRLNDENSRVTCIYRMRLQEDRVSKRLRNDQPINTGYTIAPSRERLPKATNTLPIVLQHVRTQI